MGKEINPPVLKVFWAKNFLDQKRKQPRHEGDFDASYMGVGKSKGDFPCELAIPGTKINDCKRCGRGTERRFCLENIYNPADC